MQECSRRVPQTVRLFLTTSILALLLSFTASAADKTSITFGGKQVSCEVVKFQKGRNDEMQMSLKMSGVEQTLPLRVFSKEDVRKCYALALEPKNAELRLGMGEYFYNKELFSEAEVELKEVARLDAKLKDKADDLLRKISSGKQLAKVPEIPKSAKTEPPPVAEVTPEKPKRAPGTGKRTIKLPDGTIVEIPGSSEYDSEEGNMMVVGGNGKPKFTVPPLSPEKMKEFLDTRLADLKSKIGGDWRMIETKHYYCFANIAKPKHEMISRDWNEKLYDLLCEVLRHKEGDKLWNNKMPIYYFDTYAQFQQFAVLIDRSPGAQHSGGYFMYRGRDVHVCIPFMKERHGTSTRLDDQARNTLYHEGTHAFLQLSGEDVDLSRWLHEGMAQFIEFWYQDAKSPEKRDRVAALARYVKINSDRPLPWGATEERPMGGTDLEGYAYAWAKLEFLFHNFDNQCLPKMINEIKSGKSEKEAIEKVFGMSLEKLEAGYQIWIKNAIKANFKFK